MRLDDTTEHPSVDIRTEFPLNGVRYFLLHTHARCRTSIFDFCFLCVRIRVCVYTHTYPVAKINKTKLGLWVMQQPWFHGFHGHQIAMVTTFGWWLMSQPVLNEGRLFYGNDRILCSNQHTMGSHIMCICIYIYTHTHIYTCTRVGWDSAVGIATRYELGGPWIESRRGEIFRTRPGRPWSPPSLLYNGYRVSLAGVKRPGRRVNQPPHLAPRLKKG